MSNVGKSLIAAGLCRIFKQDGYSPAPFKSQNMALNSFITSEGLEMGRAQVMQAEAAGLEPSVLMNPILLKPTSNIGSQVIVNGEVLGNMKAKVYFEYKKKLVPDIMKAYNMLSEKYSPIVIEGAGSPAEINLKENDIVNMGMADMADSPVILVGDIDRGGVFAQLLGTLMLLEDDERKLVKGLVINKFRGDKTILDPGIKELEERSGIPVVGVVPYMDLRLPEEDSLSDRFERRIQGDIDIAVIAYPRISNYTDFDVFEGIDKVSVRYIKSPSELNLPDMIILPGTKNTISDLKWLRDSGFFDSIYDHINKGGLLFGICGGFQMMGRMIKDPYGVEGSSGEEIRGLDIFPHTTILEGDKKRTQINGTFDKVSGILKELSYGSFEGYEIHMGRTIGPDERSTDRTSLFMTGNSYGTYIHGIFDRSEVANVVLKVLADKNGLKDIHITENNWNTRDREYDRLSEILREYMDINYIYKIVNGEV